MRRPLRTGLAIVVVYIVAVSATVALRGDHERPLYDSFVPPSSYRWVYPPAFFAAGNVKPTAAAATVALGPRGSAAVGLATPDGQFVVNLGAGAIARADAATEVAIRIIPVRPRDLPPVPRGLRANGNAYRLQLTYEPRGGAVERFTKAGTLVVEIPEVGQRLFVSSAGNTWKPVPARVFSPSGLTMTAPLVTPGYYVAATDLPELAAPPGHSSHTALLVGVVVAALAALMFLGAFVVARRRRRST